MKLNKFIFTIFMILLMPFSLYAVPSDTVSVSLDTASGIPGDILTIPVKVVNTTGLKVISFEVEITYNNTFLDTAGIDTTGTLSSLYDGNFYSNIVSPGLYRIVATSGADSITIGDTTLVKVRFKILPSASGVINLTFGNILFNELPDTTLAVVKTSGSITITNQMPILSIPTIPSATQDSAFTITISATDPDSSLPFTYSVINAPGGMTIDSSTGVINWTPNKYQVGDTTFSVIVTDALNGYDSALVTVTVLNINDPPEITTPTTISATEGSDISYNFSVFDVDGDDITYSLYGAETWMGFNSITGLLTGDVDSTRVKPYNMTLIVADTGDLKDTLHFTLNIQNVDNPHVITSFTRDPPTAKLGIEQTFTMNISDADITYNPQYSGQTFVYKRDQTYSPQGIRFFDTSTQEWVETTSNITDTEMQIKWTPLGESQLGVQTAKILVVGYGTTTYTVTGTYNISVAANTPPAISAISNVTAQAGQAIPPIQVQVSDSDGNPLSYSISSVSPSNPGITISNTGLIEWSNPQLGSFTVTVQVSDLTQSTIVPTRNNVVISTSSPTSFVIDVVETTNNPPGFVSIPLTDTAAVGMLYSWVITATDPELDTLSYSLVTFPAGMTIGSATGEINWTPTASQAGLNSVTVRVSDATAYTDSTFSLYVKENAKPYFTDFPVDVTLNVGQSYASTVSAVDPENMAVTYLLIAFPSGMTINSISGLINWTPVSAQIGSNLVTLEASDGLLVSDSSFTITVLDTTAGNQAPYFSIVPLDTTIIIGGFFTATLSAVDPEGNIISYSLVSSPTDMLIDSITGMINWTPSATQVGLNTVIMGASDGLLVSNYSFTITVTDTAAVNQPPYFTIVPLDTTIMIGEYFTTTLSAVDPEGNIISYSLVSAPTGMLIDSITGMINWTPSASQVGLNSVIMGASDGLLVSNYSFTITVTDTIPANQMPYFTIVPNDTTIKIGEFFTTSLSAVDPEGSAISYSLVSGPTGMTIDPITGTIDWTPATGQEGANTVTVGASDGLLVSNYSFTVTVSANQPPYFTYIPFDTTIWVGEMFTATLSSVDPEGQQVIYSFVSAPTGMTIEPLTGLINWIPDNPGNYNITVKISDIQNGINTKSFNITVVQMTYTIAAYAGFGGTISPSGNVVAYQDSSIDFTITPDTGYEIVDVLIDSVSYGAISTYKFYNIRANHTISAQFDITNTPPHFVHVPHDTTIETGVLYSETLSAEDLETPNNLIYALKEPAPLGMSIDSLSGVISWTPQEWQLSSYEIRVSVRDDKSVVDSTFSINVILKNTPPVITYLPYDVTIQAGQYFTDKISAYDNETPADVRYFLQNPPVGMNIIETDGTISWAPTDTGFYAINLTVTDGKAYVDSSFTIQVTSIDNPPVITEFPLDTLIEANSVYTATVSGYDPEGKDITYSFIRFPLNMEIGASDGVITWTPTETQISLHEVTVELFDGILKSDSTFRISVFQATNLPPVVASPLQGELDTTVMVGETFSFQISATDPEGNPLTYTLRDVYPFVTNPVSVNAQTGLVTWAVHWQDGNPTDIGIEVSDGVNQVYVHLRIWIRNNPPVIYSPSDGLLDTTITAGTSFNYQVNAIDPDGFPIHYMIENIQQSTKNPISIDPVAGLISWLSDLNDPPVINFKIRSSDGVLDTTAFFTIHLEVPVNNPVIVNSPVVLDTTILKGSLFAYQIDAFDPENRPLNYFLISVNPTQIIPVTIEPTTGFIRWQSKTSDADYFKMKFGISDGVNDTVVVLNIGLENSPPIVEIPVTGMLDTTINAGSEFIYQIKAFDPEGIGLRYILESPSHPTINPIEVAPSLGTIRWQSTFNDYKETHFKVFVKDGVNVVEVGFIINLLNSPPIVHFPLVSKVDTSIEAGSTFNYKLEVEDPEGQQIIYQIFQHSPYPMNSVNIDAFGSINWKSEVGDASPVNFDVEISDGANDTLISFSIELTIPGNEPPVVLSPVFETLDTTITAGSEFSFQIIASDPEQQSLSYHIIQPLEPPVNPVVIDTNIGSLSWKSDLLDESNVVFGVVVSDGENNVTIRFDMHLQNLKPSFIDFPNDTAIYVGDRYIDYVSGIDPEGIDLIYSIESPPGGMFIDAQTGVIEWVPGQNQIGSNIIKLIISDHANIVERSYNITVLEPVNNPPVVVYVPGDTSIESETVYSGNISYYDPEGLQISYVLYTYPTGMRIDPIYGNIDWTPTLDQVGEHSISIEISDNVNVIYHNYRITVFVDNPPVITNIPSDRTIEIDESLNKGGSYVDQVLAYDPEGKTIIYSLSNPPEGMSIDSLTGVISWTPKDGQEGRHKIIIVISDGRKLNIVHFFLTVVKSNLLPPVITYIPSDTTIEAGVEYMTKIEAYDPEGAALLFSLKKSPVGMYINQVDGIIMWSPSLSQVGIDTVEVEVSDGVKTTTDDFIITVASPVNEPPIFTLIPNDSTIDVEIVYNSTVEGYDPEGSNVYYSLDSSPAGMSIVRTTGVITWTPLVSQVGENIIRVSISDNEKFATVSFTLTVNPPPNQSPKITQIPEDGNISVGMEYTAIVEGTDPENQTVSYYLSSSPVGMNINSSTGEIIWIPTEEQVKTHQITVRVSDGEKYATGYFNLTVYEPFNAVPVITEFPTDGVIGLGQTYTSIVRAFDPEKKPLIFSLLNPPSGMTINSGSGVINWISGGAQVGTYLIKVNVSDGVKSITKGFKLTVTQKENKLPVVTVFPEDDIIKAEFEYTAYVNATDPENQPISYIFKKNPDGMTIDIDGKIVWTPKYQQVGKYEIIVIVTDGAQKLEDSFILTVSEPGPMVSGIYPITGSTDKDETVVVLGKFFKEGVVVEIADKTLENLIIRADGSLTGILKSPVDAGVYDVTVTNPDGQFAILSNEYLVIEPPKDETPPNFAKGSPYNLPPTMNEATIVIYNDEYTKGSISYGTESTNLGSIVDFTDFSMSHSINLENLNGGTTYYYQATVTDTSGNSSVSLINSFTTEAEADNTPPIITVLKPITEFNSATIKFITNEVTDAFARYRISGSGASFIESEKSQLKKEHYILLKGLNAATIYEYRITATDQSKNRAEISVDEFGNILKFTTKSALDTIPPIIESVRVEGITDKSAKILWYTKEPSTSTVEYGLTNKYGKKVVANFKPAPQVQTHVVDLTNLESAKEYHFRVISEDGSGNISLPSRDATFVTEKSPDLIPPKFTINPSITGKTDKEATISFGTNEFSDTRVYFREDGTGSDYAKVIDYTLVKPGELHVITIYGLKPETKYEYMVETSDESGNISKVKGSDSPFMTKKEPDVTAPRLIPGGTPIVIGITQKNAIIVWETNEYSSSRIDYGTTLDLGFTERGEPGKKHSVALSDLAANTKYFYRVSSRDESGNLFVDIERPFTTEAEEDVTPPKITSPPNIVKVKENNATIYWETNEASTSFVEYWKDGTTEVKRSGDDKFTIFHKVTLHGLEPGTSYHYRVISIDNSPNKNTTEMVGLNSPFKTLMVASRYKPRFRSGKPPWARNFRMRMRTLGLIKSADETNVGQEVAVASVTIEWGTDIETDSRIDYGLTTEYGSSVYDGNLVTDHSILLDDLLLGTIYHYKITSMDADSNVLVGVDQTFRTPDGPDTSPPNVIEDPIVSDKTKNTAVIEWRTDEDSDSFVEYWQLEKPGNIKKEGMSDVSEYHKVTLTNLEPGKYYRYFVMSTDVSENRNTVKVEGTDSPFQIPEEEDTKPPTINSGPDVPIITLNSATIIWKTDELAISLIKYGPIGDGLTEEMRTSVYDFTQKFDLMNLAANTEYKYKVFSYDKAGNELESKLIKKFKTLAVEDETPPVLIEGPICDFKDKSASFYWVTDEDANSNIFYKVAGSADPFRKVASPDMVKEHNVVVLDLGAGTDYWFVISSTDYNFNTMAVYPVDFYGDSTLFKSSKTLKVNQPPGGTGRFRTKSKPDLQAPVIISGPFVTNLAKSAATIKWTTNENSNSFVNYGLTEEYGLKKGTSFNITEHEVTLTNLDSATTYNYQVSSTDLSKNEPTLSKNAAITTLDEEDIIPPVITDGPNVVSITDNEATVMWNTDEPGDSYIEFGFDTTSGELDTSSGPILSKSLPMFVVEHKLTLTNLLKNTLYYFRISSTDRDQNGPTYSAIGTFRTTKEPDIISPTLIDSIRITSVSDRAITISWRTNELSDSFIKYDSTAAVQKRITLRKAGHYIEEIFENTIGSSKDVTEHKITLTDLKPGTEYTFQPGSIDKSDNEWLSSFMLFTTTAAPDVTPPAKPQNLKAIPGNEKIILIWDKNTESDLAGYNVYRFVDDEFKVVFSQLTDTFYVAKGLNNDETYYYKITAIDNQSPYNESGFSDEKLVKPTTSSAPTAPVLFSPADDAVVENAKPTLTIYNSQSVRDGLTYTFIVSTDSTFNTNLVVFQPNVLEGQDNTSLTLISALADKTQYYWRTRAYDGYFYSDWMETALFRTELVTAVELISFKAVEIDRKVVLNWETASEENNLGFYILRSDRKDGEFIDINENIIKSNPKGKYSYIDKDIELGNTYYYILQSVDINGQVNEYETVSITLKLPDKYTLYQNYPNPFNPFTNIKFDLPMGEKVVLKIYNILGQEIKTLVDKEMDAGAHTVQWDGTNNFGLKVSSGIYIYQLRTRRFIKAKKMTLIK